MSGFQNSYGDGIITTAEEGKKSENSNTNSSGSESLESSQDSMGTSSSNSEGKLPNGCAVDVTIFRRSAFIISSTFQVSTPANIIYNCLETQEPDYLQICVCFRVFF